MFGNSMSVLPGIGHGHLNSPGWRKHHAGAAAQQALQTTGVSQSAYGNAGANDIWTRLNGSVASLRTQLEELGTNTPAGDIGASASVTGAQLINKQRGVMEIHTQEGDVVTLSFSARTAVTYSSAQVSDGTTQISSSELTVASRSRLSVQVEGDLNAEELTAIDDLVDQVSQLTDAFFAGDVDAALAQATRFSYDGTQLADYTIDLKFKQSFYGYTAAAMPATTAPANESATPDTTASADEPASENSAVDGATITPAEETTAPVAAESPSEAPSEATPDAGTGSSLSLLEYREKVRASFGEHGGNAWLGLSYELKVKLLVTSIQQSAPAGEVSDAAADGLTAYLNAPAA